MYILPGILVIACLESSVISGDQGTSRVLPTQFVWITQPQKHIGELGLGVVMGKDSSDGRGAGVAVGVTLGGGVDMSGGRRHGQQQAGQGW